MADLIPFAGIGHLFREFKHTAWRLETRRAYAADLRTGRYRHFLETGQLLDDSDDPWVTNVAMQLEQGKRLERVRVVDDPLTDNQRYYWHCSFGGAMPSGPARSAPSADQAADVPPGAGKDAGQAGFPRGREKRTRWSVPFRVDLRRTLLTLDHFAGSRAAIPAPHQRGGVHGGRRTYR